MVSIDRAEVVLDFGEAWAATPGNWNNSTADINLRFGIAEIASEAASTPLSLGALSTSEVLRKTLVIRAMRKTSLTKELLLLA